ncbi:MAG: hypothetical protein IT168_23995 [Bryobacterales bacterium]|nr:hypothetical protein [Bryobacterales bacterium]
MEHKEWGTGIGTRGQAGDGGLATEASLTAVTSLLSEGDRLLIGDSDRNEDGVRNDSIHPAAKGSTIVLYGTGLGQTTPAGVDGAVTSPGELPAQTVRISVQIGPIGGVPESGTVLYAGPAPGLISGVFQINVKLPPRAASGQNYVQLLAGSATHRQVIFVE